MLSNKKLEAMIDIGFMGILHLPIIELNNRYLPE